MKQCARAKGGSVKCSVPYLLTWTYVAIIQFWYLTVK